MSRKLGISLICLSALALAPRVSGQTEIRPLESHFTPADSADVAYYGKKDFRQAALTVAGMNLSVWAFDRYVQNADYAKISWVSIRDNFTHGFVWDNDQLGTNMFLHPYHGNLYFNAARSNGFNYWQSGLFALAGSAMWEMIFENEYPSINDIISTPVGGMAIGEVAFRTSDLMIADNTRGWARLGHEAAAFVISPMRGLTRVINGDAWRYRPTSGRVYGYPELHFEVSAGARLLGYRNEMFSDHGVGFTMELNMEYGDRFELRSERPYDYFKLRVDLAVQRSQPVLSQVNILGRLISREVVDSKHHDVSVGLYQHYDYYDSDTISEKTAKTPYKLAVPASVGAGVLYRGTGLGKWTLDAYAHVNAIMMGGILSDHYKVDMRNYNLASGFGLKVGANTVFDTDRFTVSASYRYFRLYTWGYPRGTDLSSVNVHKFSAEGDRSVAYFGVADARVDYRLVKNLYLTAGFTHYMRSTIYRDYPHARSSSFATRLMLTYRF